MPNPVIHFEILGGSAPGQLQDFYRSIFGWHIDANNPMHYGLVDTHSDHGIGGGVGPSENGKSLVTIYVQVDDLDAFLKKAEARGRQDRGAAHGDPGHGDLRDVRRPQRQRHRSRQELTRPPSRPPSRGQQFCKRKRRKTMPKYIDYHEKAPQLPQEVVHQMVAAIKAGKPKAGGDPLELLPGSGRAGVLPEQSSQRRSHLQDA